MTHDDPRVAAFAELLTRIDAFKRVDHCSDALGPTADGEPRQIFIGDDNFAEAGAIVAAVVALLQTCDVGWFVEARAKFRSKQDCAHILETVDLAEAAVDDDVAEAAKGTTAAARRNAERRRVEAHWLRTVLMHVLIDLQGLIPGYLAKHVSAQLAVVNVGDFSEMFAPYEARHGNSDTQVQRIAKEQFVLSCLYRAGADAWLDLAQSVIPRPADVPAMKKWLRQVDPVLRDMACRAGDAERGGSLPHDADHKFCEVRRLKDGDLRALARAIIGGDLGKE